VRKTKALNLAAHRKRRRTGHALATSKGIRAITQRSSVRRGSSTAVMTWRWDGLIASMALVFAAPESLSDLYRICSTASRILATPRIHRICAFENRVLAPQLGHIGGS